MTRHAKYKDFSIGDEVSGFQLSVGSYSGDAGDALAYSNGMKFTTYDEDNDTDGSNCAIQWSGGFWYHSCYHTNPFGPIRKKGDGMGMRWNKWLSGINIKKMVFKISPRTPTII
ncbi:unnamed protein product [Meganyctiphanes norvegica]|uniref:Fibrinogen C-terminal domain-containing protein n=1 Tax=Meganyctiphanes norvegica TaxID=48144 RepID=A0AAV2S679_MEGNR